MTEKKENTNTDLETKEVVDTPNVADVAEDEDARLDNELASLKESIEKLNKANADKEKQMERQKRLDEIESLKQVVKDLAKNATEAKHVEHETRLDGVTNITATSSSSLEMNFDLFNEETNKNFNELVDRFVKQTTTK